jgi:hypothetical protein
MAGPTTYPSSKQFVGVAKETTPGTPVAMAFTQLVEKFDPEDKITGLIDKSMRGSMVEEYAYIQGVRSPSSPSPVRPTWTASASGHEHPRRHHHDRRVSAPFSHAISC